MNNGIQYINSFHPVDTYFNGKQIAGSVPKVVSGDGHVEWESPYNALKEVNLFGKSEQQTFTGKNLLNINDLTAVNAQATRCSITDNIMTLTSYSQGAYWHQIRFYVNSFDASLHVGKQITWSFDAEEMLSEYRYQPTVNGYNASKARISSTHINFSGAETGKKSITYTIPENCRYIVIEFQAPLTTEDFGEKIVGVFSEMQLEIGAVATEYEPYFGGIPSPNPDYPQEVVGNNARVRATGINLWGGSKLADDFEVCGATKESDGSIRYYHTDMVAESGDGWITKYPYKGSFKPNTVYTIILYGKTNYTSGNGSANLTFLYEDGTTQRIAFPAPLTENTYAVVTSNGKTIRGIVGDRYAGRIRLYPEQCGLFEGKVTVEEFTPYYDGGEAVAPELYAIGDYKDEWNPQTGKGLRRIGKVELKGGGYWSATASRVFTNDVILSNAVPHTNMNTVANILCSHYEAVTHGITFYNSKIGISYYSGTLSFSFGTGTTYTVAEWTAHLKELYDAGTPITIYYALAEPVPFETEPMPLTCPVGYGQLIQLDGNIADCPVEVTYLESMG